MLYDKDIREPLFEFLEERYGKVRVIEEKQMGRSRADVIMVRPGSLTGIEIKSDADSYARLTRQVKDYDWYFDYNYVAIGSSHGNHIKEHVPDWWGIITVERAEFGLDFYVLREAVKNPGRSLRAKLGLLWRPELAHIQEIHQMPRYSEKSKAFVMDKILLKVPEEILDSQISQELFERDYTTIAERIETYRGEMKSRSMSGGVLMRKKRRKISYILYIENETLTITKYSAKIIGKVDLCSQRPQMFFVPAHSREQRNKRDSLCFRKTEFWTGKSSLKQIKKNYKNRRLMLQRRKTSNTGMWGCLFLLRINGRKGEEESRMAKEYDIDGCYCLLLAIEYGIGASAALALYRHGAGRQSGKDFKARGRPPDGSKPIGCKEQGHCIRELRKQGYTLEQISELLGRDSSTVKRKLKRMEETKE